MQFLATAKEIERTLTRLLNRCDRLRWAVAWATCHAPPFKSLKAAREKIDQLTVGTHLYQTDPDFIAEFLGHPNAKFVLNTNGLFHPKLYYFETGDGWDAVIGSSNFTGGGLSQGNAEVAVHISNDDLGAEDARSQLQTSLDRYTLLAESVTLGTLEHYRSIWRRQRKRLAALEGRYGSSERERPKAPLTVPLFAEQWPQFYAGVLRDPHFSPEARLTLLEQVRALFQQHPRFFDFSEQERKQVGGFIRTEELDWKMFGSMSGAGTFGHALGANNARVSDALDQIPLEGSVTSDDYDRFARIYQGSFDRAARGTASRLLAMKRPDYFVCLDSKNQASLCRAFGIAQNVKLGDYWDKVIARIIDSNWWNSEEPSAVDERRFWQCRSAFLDVRFYEP